MLPSEGATCMERVAGSWPRVGASQSRGGLVRDFLLIQMEQGGCHAVFGGLYQLWRNLAPIDRRRQLHRVRFWVLQAGGPDLLQPSQPMTSEKLQRGGWRGDGGAVARVKNPSPQGIDLFQRVQVVFHTTRVFTYPGRYSSTQEQISNEQGPGFHPVECEMIPRMPRDLQGHQLTMVRGYPISLFQHFDGYIGSFWALIRGRGKKGCAGLLS